MKVTKHPAPCFARLAQFACTEKGKPHLSAIHHDRELPYLVATDGKKLYATRNLHRPDQAGETFDAEPYFAHMAQVRLTSNFPYWKAVVPNDEIVDTYLFQVPAGIAKLKQSLRLSVTFLCLNGKPILTFGAADSEKNEYAHSIDLSFFAPWAGQTIRVHFSKWGKPALVTDSTVTIGRGHEVFVLEWFALLMPLSIDKALIERVNRAQENLPEPLQSAGQGFTMSKLTERNRDMGVDYEATWQDAHYSIYAEGKVLPAEADTPVECEVSRLEIFRAWPGSFDQTRVANSSFEPAVLAAIKDEAAQKLIEQWHKNGGN